MESEEYNLESICRVCKRVYPEMHAVFGDDELVDNVRIDEKLMDITSLKVLWGDGLPILICKACLATLNIAYQFKQQCEQTDTSLRNYIRMRNIKSESLPNDFNDAIFNMYNSSGDGQNIKQEPDMTLNRDYVEITDSDKVIFTCKTCEKSFFSLDGLRSHKRLHTGDLFKCTTCRKEYTRASHLQRHMMSHGRRKVHVCKICNKTLTRFEHLKRHLITHLKDKPFHCDTCKRGFNRSEHLLNHVKRCRGDRVFVCDICNKGFNREDSLEVHKRLHDNKAPVLPTLDNLDNIQEHYIEIEDFDGKSDAGSDVSEVLSEVIDDSECFEPQVDIVEREEEDAKEEGQEQEQEEQDVKKDFTAITDEELYAALNDGSAVEEYQNDDNNDRFDDDTDSCHSEYLPTNNKKFKAGKPKRKVGRPRKKQKKQPSVREKREKRASLRSSGEIKIENEEDGDYPCPNCSIIFQNDLDLQMHMCKCTGEIKKSMKRSAVSSSSAGAGFKKKSSYSCQLCPKKFTRNNHLKRHMVSHGEGKMYSCTICTRTFTRRDHMTQHMRLHTASKQHECDICKRPFGRAEHLIKHKASKHNIGEKVMNEKKFKCSVCGKGFTTEKYRDVHMRGHNGEKKWSCKTCDKSFLSKSHLTEHMKFHNEHSKKFLCSECGQRFIRNDYLVIHMRRHRGEKPFKCKYCGKGFPRTTDLTVHERYHTGEKTHLCTICGRGFGRAYNLTVHMRTHTGEKPYQCTYCDAAFAQGNDLKAHVRRHTGERFQCDLCTDSFLMGYLLTQHKRTVHGINVVSNIRRLQPFPAAQKANTHPPVVLEGPPVPAIHLPTIPVHLQAQIAAQMHHQQLTQQLVQEQQQTHDAQPQIGGVNVLIVSSPPPQIIE